MGKTVQLDYNSVNMKVVEGLGWILSFSLSNKDGSTYTAPSGMTMGFKAGNQDILTLTSPSNGITITQNGAKVDVLIKMSNSNSALFDVGNYSYTLSKTEDGLNTICFDGVIEVAKNNI